MDEQCECPECTGDPLAQMEAIAHYADVIRKARLDDLAYGSDLLSGRIMEDIAVYWTGADTRWLLLMTDLISTKRSIAALEAKPGRKFRSLLKRWF